MSRESLEYTQLSDETLLNRIKEQDSQALAELYDRHAQVAFNLISRIIRNQAVAEDLLQDVFFQVWQKAESYTGQGSVTAWLFRVARNRSLDQLRRQKARPQPLETNSEDEEQSLWDQIETDDTAIEQVVTRRWNREALVKALAEIPTEQRRCLELAYFNGLSQSQIAEQMKVPLGTVKTRLRIGLQKLQRIFQDSGYVAKDIVGLIFLGLLIDLIQDIMRQAL